MFAAISLIAINLMYRCVNYANPECDKMGTFVYLNHHI